MRGRKPLPERERIYAKVDMQSADGCWQWTASPISAPAVLRPLFRDQIVKRA